MPKPTFYLLQNPFYVEEAPSLIGSLVTDVMRPMDSYYATNATVVVSYLRKPLRQLYASISSHGANKDAIELHLDSLFGIGTNNGTTNHIQLLSKEIQVHSAERHQELLQKVVQQPGAEIWMERAGHVYMLVSYLSAQDAQVRSGSRMVSNFTGGLSVPIAEATGLPLNFDVGFEGSQETHYGTLNEGLIPGDVIFAAEYRRVKKKRFLFRSQCRVGGYPTGSLAFGDETDSEDECVEIEKYGYDLEDNLGPLVIELSPEGDIR
jgi:hypothetical protein